MASLMAWLVPAAGPERDLLAATIIRLAAEHDTAPFAPHITMAGRFRSGETAAIQTLRQLAAGIPPFEVTLHATGHEQSYFRSLYLCATASSELAALDGAARQAWGLELPPYRPHLSLLYSDLTEDRKRPIIDGLNLSLPLTVRIDAIELWADEQPGVPGWRRAGRVPLAGDGELT